jgi:hypothetical protein
VLQVYEFNSLLLLLALMDCFVLYLKYAGCDDNIFIALILLYYGVNTLLVLLLLVMLHLLNRSCVDTWWCLLCCHADDLDDRLSFFCDLIVILTYSIAITFINVHINSSLWDVCLLESFLWMFIDFFDGYLLMLLTVIVPVGMLVLYMALHSVMSYISLMMISLLDYSIIANYWSCQFRRFRFYIHVNMICNTTSLHVILIVLACCWCYHSTSLMRCLMMLWTYIHFHFNHICIHHDVLVI